MRRARIFAPAAMFARARSTSTSLVISTKPRHSGRSTRPVISSAVEKSNYKAWSTPFVRRCRSEISPRARLSASLGRNDKRGKRGWSTCSPCHFVMRRGIRVDLPTLSFRAQSRNLTIKPGRHLLSVAVAPRFLHALGLQPRLVEMTKGGNAGGRPPPPLSFQLNRGIRVDLPAPSFRAQSRNLTIKPGRHLLSVAYAPRFLHALGLQPRLVEMTKWDAGAIYCSIKQILLFNIDYFISINNIYT